MITELKAFAIRLIATLIITPFVGWIMLRLAEKYEKYWKSGNRKQRWLVMCGIFFFLAAGIGGWLQ
jgi:hypothetical protein